MAQVGCLPNGNRVVIVQIFLYFAAAILGFLVVIPIGVTLRNFWGSCILFAQIVVWDTNIIWPWNEPACIYILYMNLAVNIFYATFMGFLLLLVYLKKPLEYPTELGKLQDWHISFILTAFNPVFMVINFCLVFLEIASACVLTAGLSQLCKYTMQYVTSLSDPTSVGLQNGTSYTCSSLQKENAFWAQMRIVRGTTIGVQGNSFVGCLALACVAAWLIFIMWFVQFGLNVLMSCRVCSCDIAEEKRKPDKTAIIASRRSRLATPIGTPGGRHTPLGGLNAPMPHPLGGQQKMVPMGVGQPIAQPMRQPEVPQYRYQDAPVAPRYSDVPSERYQEAPALEKKAIPPTPSPAAMPPPYATVTPPRSSVDGPPTGPSPLPLPTPKSKPVYRKNPSQSELI